MSKIELKGQEFELNDYTHNNRKKIVEVIDEWFNAENAEKFYKDNEKLDDAELAYNGKYYYKMAKIIIKDLDVKEKFFIDGEFPDVRFLKVVMDFTKNPLVLLTNI